MKHTNKALKQAWETVNNLAYLYRVQYHNSTNLRDIKAQLDNATFIYNSMEEWVDLDILANRIENSSFFLGVEYND